MKKLPMALLTLAALLTLSSIALIVSVSADPASQVEPTNFTAQLSGDQEVPPRTTEATGQATFQLSNETQLDFTLNLVNLKNVVAAHIHCAPAEENGAVGVTLRAGSRLLSIPTERSTRTARTASPRSKRHSRWLALWQCLRERAHQ
jgi:Cu/Zn superoxide dismutase